MSLQALIGGGSTHHTGAAAGALETAFVAPLQGGYANYWGKWRAELDRCTDLAVCLEGLHDSLRGCLAASFAAGAEE